MPDNIIFIYYITISEKIKEFFIKFLHFVLFDDCFVFLPVFHRFCADDKPDTARKRFGNGEREPREVRTDDYITKFCALQGLILRKNYDTIS